MGFVDQVINFIPALLRGALVTLELTVVSVIVGILLGLVFALFRISKNKALNGIGWFYVWVFRGTPLLMQLMFIYYGLPLINPAFTFDKMASGLLGLSLNSAAYLAEIIRAAIQSIDKGQLEASKALGMTYGQAMRKIIIPQSYRRLIPPVGNEIIMLLKDSALVSVISLTEILRATKQKVSATGDAALYLPAAVIYLFLTSMLQIIFDKLEKKFSIYE